jgi:hypothetical protein
MVAEALTFPRLGASLGLGMLGKLKVYDPLGQVTSTLGKAPNGSLCPPEQLGYPSFSRT